MKGFLLVGVAVLWTQASFAQTAIPRPDGGLNVTCPNGRTGTITPQGTSVIFNVREPNGRTWAMAEEPSISPGDPNNRVGNPRTMAALFCSAS